MTSRPEPVLLIIADISGYTQFMIANAKSLAHAQAIITELVASIIREVELPLTVAKLEGDAVFLYVRKADETRSWPETRKMIGDRLLRFFSTFESKLRELRGVTTCECHSCRSMERLRLKLIVHSGEALFHHVFGAVDLAGVDVIIAHRLLKNSVAAEQYILMTEPATRDVEFPFVVPFKTGKEELNDIGVVKTHIYQPQQTIEKQLLPRRSRAQMSYRTTVSRSARWFLRLWFQPLLGTKQVEANDFHNLKTAAARPQNILYKIFTVLAAPLFVPVGLVFVWLRMTGRYGKRSLQRRGYELRSEAALRQVNAQE